MSQQICFVAGASKIDGLGLNTAIELGRLGYFVIPTAKKEKDLEIIRQKQIK